MSNDMLRIGVVGLGYWGPNLVRVLHDLPDVEVAWLCDSRADALAKVSRRYPAPAVTSRLVDLLDDPDLDAIVLATPVSTHYKLAKTALASGKHVFVEKPLASSSAEALELIELAAETDLVLMPGHTFLYSPPVNLGRELIRSGELGEIYFISTSRVNLGLHQSDISVVWDLGPHDFSILRYWLDETPVRASALSRSCIIDGTPDVAFIDLEFPSRTIAHVELSWLAPSKLRRTAIVGSRKMLVYDDTSAEPIRVFDSGADLPDPETFGEFRLSYRTGDIVSPRVEVTEPLQLELDDFCSAIRSGREPRSSAHIGLDVIQMTEAVDRSLANGGQPVELESLAQSTVD
jgi:predicted dehydrogenase